MCSALRWGGLAYDILRRDALADHRRALCCRLWRISHEPQPDTAAGSGADTDPSSSTSPAADVYRHRDGYRLWRARDWLHRRPSRLAGDDLGPRLPHSRDAERATGGPDQGRGAVLAGVL